MPDKQDTPTTIDAYIARFPPEVQELLTRIRATIHEAAPDATEGIGYQMPGFYLNGGLVYFAAFKNHIGFYPTGSALPGLDEDLSAYRTSKGTLQFPYDRPIPYDLIRKIVQVRAAENLSKPRRRSG